MRKSWIKRGKKKLGKSPKYENRRICDYMWGTIIILRDQICKICLENIAMQGHHIFAKRECPSTRYDLRIGIGVCGGCHDPKLHTNPEMYRHILIAHVGGQETYDRLKALASIKTDPRHDYALIELLLWQDLAEYGVERPDGWREWKEWKKEKWLRDIRKNAPDYQ